MGLSLAEQAQSIWSELKFYHDSHPAAEADISGFDWSVQSWELWADLEMRLNLGDFDGLARKVAINRWYCFVNSVFQLSDGRLISQGRPGLMKSGSYCTSSTNSRIRCLMAEIIGAPWCIAMGDDSVEGYTEGAKEKYSALGHTCKQYDPCELDSAGKLLRVNFCSHELSENRFYLTSWPRTLYRYLCNPRPDIGDLQAELGANPHWGRIYAYVSREGPAHKTKQGNAEEAVEYNSRRPEDCHSRGQDDSEWQCPEPASQPAFPTTAADHYCQASETASCRGCYHNAKQSSYQDSTFWPRSDRSPRGAKPSYLGWLFGDDHY